MRSSTRDTLVILTRGALGLLTGCGSILGIERFTPVDDAGHSQEPAQVRDASAESGMAPDDGPAPDAGPAADLDAGSEGDSAPPAQLEAGTDAVVRACMPAATRCVGNAVSTCSAVSQWSEVVACKDSQRCLEGACKDFPSCATTGPGLSDCGPNKESCCQSLGLPAGTYSRVYTTNASGVASNLSAPASVSAFRLDTYLVTVGRFRQFLAALKAGYAPVVGAGKHTHLNAGMGVTAMGGGGYESGWTAADGKPLAPADEQWRSCDPHTWTTTAGANEALPMSCVGWAEAYAFCIWDGGFLPDEAEWEYAAAGGAEQRRFPWGATPAGTANQYAIYGCLYPAGPVGLLDVGLCNARNVAPVGTPALGVGRWGQRDLAGQLYEWNLDFHPGMDTVPTGYAALCTDCAYLTQHEDRLVRGGQYGNPESSLLATHRYAAPRAVRASGIGIRCARAP
jgi:formylglycine-generating enzyme required for sulfatase activity